MLLGLAYWWRNTGVGRNVIAFLAAIALMVYTFSLVGMFIFGRVPSKGYVAAILGMYAGAIVGIGAGILLGRAAVGRPWLYWTVVLIEAGVMVFLPKLV